MGLLMDEELYQQMEIWRHDFHKYPETAYEEHRTARIVADLLKSFGITVHTGIAETGVVGVLEGDLSGNQAIGLRADMDALPITEQNTVSYCSHNKGKMHACGHDGHTAMLLGAAKYLSENRDFRGRVIFIFQPAEEGEAGAKRMLDEGVFEQFPVDAVFGMHNWPGLPVGHFGVHAGPVMAAMDTFDITITGKGGHAAMPHQCIDPVMVSSHLMVAIQSIMSRELDPLAQSVLTITKIHGGDAYNVIPHQVVLCGTCRTFDRTVRDKIESRLRLKIEQVCGGFGATGSLNYIKRFPATINHKNQAEFCASVAKKVVGRDAVYTDIQPSMASEDFAYFLLQKPGAFVWIGNGPADEGRKLHNPCYDFNDEALIVGANFWVQLVQSFKNT